MAKTGNTQSSWSRPSETPPRDIAPIDGTIAGTTIREQIATTLTTLARRALDRAADP